MRRGQYNMYNPRYCCCQDNIKNWAVGISKQNFPLRLWEGISHLLWEISFLSHSEAISETLTEKEVICISSVVGYVVMLSEGSKLKNSILAKHYWIGDAENMIRLLMNGSTTS
jgi:hypothetical protein